MDFLPKVVTEGGIFSNPKFESLEICFERMNKFVRLNRRRVDVSTSLVQTKELPAMAS